MNRIVRITGNIVTGVFVTFMAFIAFGISGIAETEQPTNDYSYFLWLLLWIAGFAMQFNKKTKNAGFVITFIPALYFLFTFLGIL